MKNIKEYLMTEDEMWEYTLFEIKKFIDENKKKPVITSKNEKEKYLSSWISNQNTNYKTKQKSMSIKEKYDMWTSIKNDEKYGKYLMTNNEIWNKNLIDLQIFLDINKKRPSKHTKNDHEKYLGTWICNQLKNYKNKKEAMKNEDIYNQWKALINDEKYKPYFE